MPKLTITEGDRTSTYEILDEVVLVGRREGASIRLSDPHASAEHCQIRYAPGFGYKLVDLESRNGTKVNGAFVNQHLLREGDTIQVGQARLKFTEAGAAPAPGPAVAPAPAAAPAPAPAAASAPAAPFPPRPAGNGDREGRPARRFRRRGSDAPVIAAAVIGGSVILVVLFLFLASSWFGMSKNGKIYEKMQELIREKRYTEAAKLADTADPGGERVLLEKIRAEAARCRDLADSSSKLGESRQAQDEFQRIESWIQDHRDQVGEGIRRWQAFAEKWKTLSPFWAAQARQRAETMLGGPTAGPKPPSGDPLGEEWLVTMATVKRHEDRNRFQDAVDAIQDFWSREQLKTGSSYEAWKKRVDDGIEKVREDAAKRYDELEAKARKLAAQGDVEDALDILKDIAQNFGMPQYQQMATEMIRRIQRD